MRRKRPEQVRTESVTIESIMRRREFEVGVRDFRLGHPSRFDEHNDNYWAYERGRQWAAIAPKTMPVKINGHLNPEAVRLFRRNDGAIL